MYPTVLVASPQSGSRFDRAELFVHKGYEVLRGTDSAQVSALIRQRTPSLILLSEDLPSPDGVELVPMMRRLTMVPLIVLGDGGISELIRYVLNGADAYITCPVDDDELLVRAKNLLRRSWPQKSPNSLDFEIDENGHNASSDEVVEKAGASLTETEMRLFRCLVGRRGRLTSGDELMSSVWGKPVNGGRLRFYIHSLRRKLDRHTPFRLHTQKGVGYRLIEPDAPNKKDS